MSSGSKPQITESSGLITPDNETTYLSIPKHSHGHFVKHGDQIGIQFPEDTFDHAVRDAYESAISDTEHDEEDEDTRWLRQERLNHKLVKWYKRPSLLMISGVMMVYALGIGLSSGPKIELFLELACKKILLEETETCSKSQTQVLVSQLQGLISVTGAIVTTLLAGKIGQYSDIYGRKLIIMYVLTMAVFARMVTLALISPKLPTLYIWYIVGGHLIESFGGGVFVFLGMCNSYITDVVEDHMRIYSIGVVIACLFIGMSLGPMFGSMLVKSTGSNIFAVYLDVVVTAMALMIVIFILPESRSQNARRKSSLLSISVEERRRLLLETSKSQYYWSKVLDSINIFTPLKMFWIKLTNPDGSKNYKPRIVVLLIILIDICLMTCTSCLSQIVVLYPTYMFDWDSVHMGYYLAITSTAKFLVLIFFSPFFLHHLKKRFSINPKQIDKLDITCIRFAVIFQTLSALVLTFAPSSKIYISHAFLLCFESIATPTLHSTVIKYASVESTGAMFGALATVRNLLHLIMPASFLYLYSETVSKEPRAAFYVQLGFVLVLIVITLLLGSHSLISGDSVISSGEDPLITNLKLQKEQRERLHRFMIMRRESSNSVNSTITGSPSKSPKKHSRSSSASVLRR